MEKQKAAFARRGLNVCSLSYDSVAVLKSFAGRAGIHFPMLSDPESKVIRAFGIFNETVPPKTLPYGVPYPGTYIVKQDGIVKDKYFEDDFRERYTASNILWRQFGQGAGPVQSSAETPHLKVSLISSDAEARPGTRLTLALELELKPRMHVYAPGVQGGYIPIAWKMAESKGWRAQEVVWPGPKLLNLPVIHETVPVYTGHLRLTRDLTIGQNKDLAPLLSPERRMTVEGTLRYQACDDKECYPPQNLPLRWQFHVNALDSQRAPEELQRK